MPFSDIYEAAVPRLPFSPAYPDHAVGTLAEVDSVVTNESHAIKLRVNTDDCTRTISHAHSQSDGGTWPFANALSR